MQTRKLEYVPCDADAPRSNTVDNGNGGWYSRPWRGDEKANYKRVALQKTNEERVQYSYGTPKKG